MDDIKKQRAKRVTKVIDKVASDFSQGMNRLQLDKLYKRKEKLQKDIADDGRSPLNRTISKQQLVDVEDGIESLLKKVDINMEIDIEVDEEAAIKFLEDNPDVFQIEEDFCYEDSDDT